MRVSLCVLLEAEQNEVFQDILPFMTCFRFSSAWHVVWEKSFSSILWVPLSLSFFPFVGGSKDQHQPIPGAVNHRNREKCMWVEITSAFPVRQSITVAAGEKGSTNTKRRLHSVSLSSHANRDPHIVCQRINDAESLSVPSLILMQVNESFRSTPFTTCNWV